MIRGVIPTAAGLEALPSPASRPAPIPPWRGLLPREYGTWAFLLVPGLAVLGAFPSLTALAVCTLFLWCFLLRGALEHPTQGATLGILLLGNLAVLHLRSLGPWWEPLVPAGLLGLALLALERRSAPKRLLPELLAALFTGLQVPTAMLALGGTRRMAWLACALALVPWLPIIAFLRLRVAQVRAEPAEEHRRRGEGLLLVGLACLAAGLLAMAWRHPAAWVAWVGILGARALCIMLPGFPRPGNAVRIGFTEIAWSLATVMVLAWSLAVHSWRLST